eukprot:403364808
MSLRQIKKQQKGGEDQLDLEEIQEMERESKKIKKPTFTAFAMSDSEEENDDDQNDSGKDEKSKADVANDGDKKKKKKKRNKKKKAKQEADEVQTQAAVDNQQPKDTKKADKSGKTISKQVDDLAYLDQIISKQQEEIKQQFGITHFTSNHDSVLRMERRFFNYKKELKSLFAKSAQAYGAIGGHEEEKEDRKVNRSALEEQYEGASKKMKRRLRMVEKAHEKNRVSTVKKYLLVQPQAEWPRVDKSLKMEHIRSNKETGQKIFSFIKLPEYQILDKEFKAVQATNDISQLMHFLQRNFYHHESLVYFADFLRIQGKFSDSFHFLERCLFAFQEAFCFEFQPVPPEKNQDEFFIPQTRLDMDHEHLNKVFAECLVKYIDILGRKGCNPQNDLFGSLLRLDFYTLRAHEYQFLIDFCRNFTKEIYPEDQQASVLIIPNLMMTTSLAKYQQELEKKGPLNQNYTTPDLEQTLNDLQQIEGNMSNLLDLNPEALLISAVFLYPKMLELLLRKVAQKQINMNTKKSHFKGFQAKTWTEILAHSLFTEIGDDLGGQHSYTWMLSVVDRNTLNEAQQEELVEEVLHKLFSIFVSRSSTLFSPDHILLWLKEVIGFVLNKLDDGSLDRDLMIAKFTSLVQSPFALSRYRSLKQSDFTDDITTINPNELLMGGGPEQQMPDQQVQAEAGMAAHQLQHMINQLNQPPPMGGRGQQMMQQQHQMPLIQDREFQNMSEDEMIAMQEALLQQMNDNEDIYIDDEEDNSAGGNNQGGAGLGGNIMNMFNNLFGFGAGNNNNQNNNPGGQGNPGNQ